MILDALGDAQSIVNVGAGAGSYEPRDRNVVAIEPSLTMIAQRPPHAAKAIQASAEHLPLPDKSFDAATAFLTTHHWSDLDRGLREMARVSRGPCVFLDHQMADLKFWLLQDYFPEMTSRLRPLLPLEKARAVFPTIRVIPVPVPYDCTDGFFCAYWRRPEMTLILRRARRFRSSKMRQASTSGSTVSASTSRTALGSAATARFCVKPRWTLAIV